MADEILITPDLCSTPDGGSGGSSTPAPIFPSQVTPNQIQDDSPSEDGKKTSTIEEGVISNLPLPDSFTAKPASWKVEEPEEPWCPIALEPELGFEPEYKHEFRASFGIGNNWCLAAASKRGRMHAHHGTYREDALLWRTEKQFSLFCVCDGAGSSKLSRIGSEFTVRNLCRLVGDDLLTHESAILSCSRESLPLNLQNILYHGIAFAAERLVSLASKAGMESKDFRCTVLTILHYHHPTGGIILFGNVGDGFLAVKRKGQPAERVGISDSGSFSGEVLCFMPDPQVGEFYKRSLDSIPPIPEEEVEAFLLCTDGVEDPFFPIHRNIDIVYQQLVNGFQTPITEVTYPEGGEPSSIIYADDPGEELLKWLSFEKRGENDDRTIVFVYLESLVNRPVRLQRNNEEDNFAESGNKKRL